jgi:hypothetical protein
VSRLRSRHLCICLGLVALVACSSDQPRTVDAGSSPLDTEALEGGEASSSTSLSSTEETESLSCSRSELELSATTERDQFVAGDPVVIEFVATNVSDRPCPVLDDVETIIRDEEDQFVIGLRGVGACISPCMIEPGSALPILIEWQQNGFDSEDQSYQVDAGRYTASIIAVSSSAGAPDDGLQPLLVTIDIVATASEVQS